MNWYVAALFLLWTASFFADGLTTANRLRTVQLAAPSAPIRLMGFFAFVAFMTLFIAGFFFVRWWVPLVAGFISVSIPIYADRVLPYGGRSPLALALAIIGAFATYMWVAEQTGAAQANQVAGLDTAWIVLSFTRPDGTTAQMSLNNPSAPAMSLADCQRLLPGQTDKLVKDARASAPIFSDASFKSAACVMSKGDPLAGRKDVSQGRPAQYQDSKYNFAFQYPENWKLEDHLLTGNEYGEVRALVKHPSRPIIAQAIVGKLDKVLSKEQYQANPNRDAIVSAMMDFTVDQVYRNAGAEKVVVVEKKAMPCDECIKFYISTMQINDGGTLALFGIHVVPFGQPYMIAFTVVSPIDKTATADNEAVTNMFNSFHVVGETPVN